MGPRNFKIHKLFVLCLRNTKRLDRLKVMLHVTSIPAFDVTKINGWMRQTVFKSFIILQ